MSVSPQVSVVVPTRNSARTIARCLESIRAQTSSAYEIIVVDNSSEDETVALARQFADVVLIGGPERSAQRNLGVHEAHGRYVFFVDSDMVLDSSVIEGCLAAVETADAVIIPEVSFGEGFWARCKALERSCYLGDDTIEAARFFRRELFERVGGYDESMHSGEDWDLHEKIRSSGGRIARVTSVIWHDEGRLTLRHLLQKKFSYGKTLDTYRHKHPSRSRTQLRLIRPAFIRNRNVLASQPLLATAMLAMKCSEFAAGAAGVVVSRTTNGRRRQALGRGNEASRT
jgi:glycosyltransferase involved in cell wall biosynthesis